MRAESRSWRTCQLARRPGHGDDPKRLRSQRHRGARRHTDASPEEPAFSSSLRIRPLILFPHDRVRAYEGPRPLALLALAALYPILTACGSASPTSSGSSGTQTSASDPPGQPMPTGDSPGWHEVIADNFNQTVPLGQFPKAVAAPWGNSSPDGWKDTSERGTYEPPKVVSIADGLRDGLGGNGRCRLDR